MCVCACIEYAYEYGIQGLLKSCYNATGSWLGTLFTKHSYLVMTLYLVQTPQESVTPRAA